MAAVRQSQLASRIGRSPLTLLVAGILLGLGWAIPSVQAQGLANPSPGLAPGAQAAAGLGTALGGGCPMGMGMSDQRFMAAMIPHHQGAIAMAELALRKARRAEIRALAQRIISSQSQEIDQMRQWYQQWFGTPVPVLQASSSGAMGMGGRGIGMGQGIHMGQGMGMGGASMPGTNLAALSLAKDFDQAFLIAMVSHHRMGVMMAAMAQIHARHPQLLELEQAMVRVQSSEINQMEAWARQWFGTP